MRRFMVMLTLPVALMTQSATAASSPDGESVRPTCANVIGGAGILVEETDGSGTVTGYAVDFGIELQTPSCRFAGYTIVVLEDLSPGAQVVATLTKKGDGSKTQTGTGELGFFVPSADDDDLACVYVTTGLRRPLDRAPDEGCLDIGTSSPGGRPFNLFH